MARRERNTMNAYAKQNAGQTLATVEGGNTRETHEYNANKPWEGLGEEVGDRKTVKGMMRAANLDWGVSKVQLQTEDGRKVPSYALLRDTDQQYLDTVGKAYVPVQNEQAFEFFNDFLGKGGAQMEVAGSLRKGAIVWGLASLGSSFTLPGGDEVKGYVLVSCPHIQGKKMLFKFTSIRGACNNMLLAALRSPSSKSKSGLVLPEFRHAHRSEFVGVAVDRAKEALGIAREQLDALGEQAATLAKKSMSRQDAIDVLQPIFAPDFDKEDGKMTVESLTPRMAQLMDILEKAPGAQPDNAWGVLNAVTYYTSHVAGRSEDRRLQQAWFGKTGRQAEQVMATLLAA